MWWLVGLLGTALLGALLEEEETDRERKQLRAPDEKKVLLSYGEKLVLPAGMKAIRQDGTILEGRVRIEAPSRPDEEIFVELGPGHVVSFRWEH